MKLVDDHGRVLDADYLVEADGDYLALIMESRSGSVRNRRSRSERNPDYNSALTILLTRLGKLNAVLADALVDSRYTQALGLPEVDRRLIQAPIRLALEPDPDALRRRLGTAQSKIAQAPEATKGGNSTKRIRLRLSVPGFQPADAYRLAQALATPITQSDLAMTAYQEGNGVGVTRMDRRYWTLASHPARYRVVDAVRNLDEDWWLTGGADLHAGDRVGIWKYKGPDDRRGIIAFAEVLTDPEMRDVSDDDLTYWIDPDGKAAAPRVRVRYVIKPSEPLWLEHAPASSVIRQLRVSRAQGGTAHHVTPDQWKQLMALVGGWPEPDTDEDGPGWPLGEVRPTVTAYFTMYRAELAGQRYVKADFNRDVQAATGRSHGAVEFKFENISFVLSEMGLPYISGYKPRRNIQGRLRVEVERLLASDLEIPRLLEEIPAPDLPPTVQLEEVDPPVMAPPSTRGRGRPTIGVDYLERQARNRDVGRKGEDLVVKYEQARLSANGRSDLAALVAHVPSTLGDGAGYDVSSFLLDGSPRHIEVKATRGSIKAPFFLSAGELRYAFEHPETYSIYRVFDLGPNPKFYKLTGDMAEILDLTPVAYQARVKGPGADST